MSYARLTYAPTHIDADAYYIAGMSVPDAFVAMEKDGKYFAVSTALELGKFQKESRCDEIFTTDELAKRRPEGCRGIDFYVWTMAEVAKIIGATSIMVGQGFPAGILERLKERINVCIATESLFPERLAKSKEQQKEIAKANKGCAAAIQWVGKQLASSKLGKGNKLILGGKVLTSEILRRGAQGILLDHGMKLSEDIIIAGGKQGCDPHSIGIGPIKANELVIVDVFQALSSSGYFGDITRTFLKGTPSAAQVKLVETVRKAQKAAVESIRDGVDGRDIHKAIVRDFEKEGYKTEQRDGAYVGFFHGTGHALGLEVHDLGMNCKGITNVSHRLGENEVYTVEPGLYYPEIGGCRIEDNGVVTKNGFKLLNEISYEWVV